jgi:hypothetical protein
MTSTIQQYRKRIEIVSICVAFGVIQCGILAAHQWLMLETDWYVNRRYDEWWKWILLALSGAVAYGVGLVVAKIVMIGLPES